jgi:hypothetical protein
MKIAPPPFPSIGCDTITVMDAVRCQGLRAAGVGFIFRYLGSLGPAERDVILASGLGLGLVTYSDAPGWVPTAEKGAAYAVTDHQHLIAAGIPLGATVMVDLEGVATTASPADVAAFINARSKPLADAGFVPGLYVGYGGGLTSDELYALPHTRHYWRSLSRVPEPSCGWVMMQASPGDIIVAGTEVDVDYPQHDFQGRQAMLVWAS